MSDLEKAGFINRGGKGSHRNYAHFQKKEVHVLLTGNEGDDAKSYQERMVKRAIREVGK